MLHFFDPLRIIYKFSLVGTCIFGIKYVVVLSDMVCRLGSFHACGSVPLTKDLLMTSLLHEERKVEKGQLTVSKTRVFLAKMMKMPANLHRFAN